MFSVRILSAAAKDLSRLDRPTAARVADRIRWLAANLESITPEPLMGNLAGFYKLRAGDCRVAYEILRDENVILIHFVGHRSEVYKPR